jgi:ABC-2 type transport system ATP-binding protein
MQEAFYALLVDVRKRGRTIFLSSHILSEVERVCDQIAVLRQGELALSASVSEVRDLAPRTVRVVFREAVMPPGGRFDGSIQVTSVTAQQWILKVRGPLGPLMGVLGGLPVADLEVREPRLEDVVIGYYRGTS